MVGSLTEATSSVSAGSGLGPERQAVSLWSSFPGSDPRTRRRDLPCPGRLRTGDVLTVWISCLLANSAPMEGCISESYAFGGNVCFFIETETD